MLIPGIMIQCYMCLYYVFYSMLLLFLTYLIVVPCDIVGILLSRETMVCAVFKAATQARARIMEILGCPIIKITFSALLMRSKGMQAIHLTLALLQELLIRCQGRVTPNNFRSSIPGLLLGFAPFDHLPIRAIERELPF